MIKQQISRWMIHCTKNENATMDFVEIYDIHNKHQIIRCNAIMNALKMNAKNNNKLEALLKDKGLSCQALSWKNSQLINIYVCIIRY